ncbi:MAG: hypothetical protein JWP49_2325 [Phenylobacterium sp.]|nr:hypothetical protein [Phenylobacterium sp.]
MSTELPMSGLSTRLAAGVPIAGLTAATALASRRSQAIADYWETASTTQHPSQLLGLQLGYWTQMLDDYAQALTESFAPFTAEATAPEGLVPAVVAPKVPEAPAKAA